MLDIQTETVKMIIQFSKLNTQGAGAQTGDCVGLIGILSVLLLLGAIGCLFIFNGKFSKIRKMITLTNKCTSYLIKNKVAFTIGFSFSVALILCLSLSFVFCNSALADAQAPNNQSEDTQLINAYVNEQTGEIFFDEGYIQNYLNCDAHVDKSNVEVNPLFLNVPGINDFRLSIFGLSDGVLFDSTISSFYTPYNQIALKANERSQISFKIDNYNVETIRQLYDHPAFYVTYSVMPCNTVRYFAPDADWGEVPHEQTKTVNKDVIISDNVNNLGKTDMVFSHWCESLSGAGDIYNPGDTYSCNEDLNLYSVWVDALNIYLSTSDPNHAHPDTDIIDYIKPGEKYFLDINLGTITVGENEKARTYKINCDTNYKVESFVIVDGESEIPADLEGIIDSDMNLKAYIEHWAFDLTFGNTDGHGSASISSLTVSSNASFTISKEEDNYGQLIIYWYTDDEVLNTCYIDPISSREWMYANWSNETGILKEGETYYIYDDLNFIVGFTDLEIKITYKVVDIRNSNGNIAPNDSQEDKYEQFSETFLPYKGQTPKGAIAFPFDNKNDFKYYFINWTKVNSEVTYDTESFVPDLNYEGLSEWKNATYIVHFATPKAVYNTNSAKTKLIFYYDEENHPEAESGLIFPVNNTKFSYDINEIVLPSWYTNMAYDEELKRMTMMPTPKCNFEVISFDKSFYNFKQLTSTSMWFMSSDVLKYVFTGYSSYYDKVGRNGESVEGIENLYTENLTECAYMFANCSDYEHLWGIDFIDLSHWHSPNLKNAAGMFMGCVKLKDINYPVFEENPEINDFCAQATDMSRMFWGCLYLSSFNFKGFFGANAENINEMFCWDYNLSSLNFDEDSHFGESIKTATSAWRSNESLIHFEPNANFMSKNTVEDVSQMFTSASLECIDLSIFPLTTSTKYNDMFYWCSRFKKIIVPETWNIQLLDIGLEDRDDTWYKVDNNSYGEKTYKLKDIPYDADGNHNFGIFTKNAAKVVLKYNDTSANGSPTFTFYYDHESHSDADIVFPVLPTLNRDYEIDPIYWVPSWFNAIPENVATFKLNFDCDNVDVIFDSSFKNFDELESLNFWFMADSYGKQPFKNFYSRDTQGNLKYGFENINTKKVKDAVCMFGGFNYEAFSRTEATDTNNLSINTYGTAIKNLDLSTFDVENNITNYEGFLANCISLENVTLKDNLYNNSNVSSMKYMFANCQKLKTITNFNTTKYTKVSNWFKTFYGCRSLLAVDLTNVDTASISNIRTKRMFEGCDSLCDLQIGQYWTVPMSSCYLPETFDIGKGANGNPWYRDDAGTYTPLHVEEINLPGHFVRNSDNFKFINLEIKSSDVSKGALDTGDVTFSIGSRIKFYVHENYLYFDFIKIGAIPVVQDIKFKKWSIDGCELISSALFEQATYIEFDSATNDISILANFVDEGLKAKAVYKEEINLKGEKEKILQFYYDTIDYSLYDNVIYVFDVKNNTYFDTLNPYSGNFVCPSWFTPIYNYDKYGYMMGVSFKSKIEAEVIVFDSTFKDYEDLKSISMWFMGDCDGNQKIKEFRSIDEHGNKIGEFNNLNSANLKDVKYAFGGIQFSFESSDQSSIGHLFSYGSSITKLDLSTLDLSNVADWSYMLCNCKGLQEVKFFKDFQDIGTSQVTLMEGMFANCDSLGSLDYIAQPIVDLNKFDTSNVTNMKNMFNGCCNLEKLDLSSFDTHLVAGIYAWQRLADGMFHDCTRLKTIVIDSIYDPSADNPKHLLKWTLNLGKDCGLEDWVENSWRDEDSNEHLSTDIPCANTPTSEDDVLSGTFVRNARDEYKITFIAEEGGLINGNEQVEYTYTKDLSLNTNINDISSVCVDDIRINTSAKDEYYKFTTWKFGEGFDDLEGKNVPVNYQQYWNIEKDGPQPDRTIIACYKHTEKTAKVIFKDDTSTGQPHVGQFTFVYDDDNHESDIGYVKTYYLDSNWNDYNLPSWYDTAMNSWIPNDDHEYVPTFDRDIEYKVDYIDVVFDDSFAYYDELRSMSCWFMPALARKTNFETLYEPFRFYTEADKVHSHFSGLENINTTNLFDVKYMFGGHEYFNDINGSIKTIKIDLSNFDCGKKDANGKWIIQPHQLTNIDGMFANCVNLTTIDFGKNDSKFITNNITSMNKTFFNCRKLQGTNLYEVLSNMNTDIVIDMSFMFGRFKYYNFIVDDVNEFTFPSNFNVENVENMSSLFAGNKEVKKIIINTNGNSWNIKNESAKKNLYAAFKDCVYLEELFIESNSFLTKMSVSNMSYMFYNCLSFTQTNILGGDNFFNCNDVEDMSYMYSLVMGINKFDFNPKFNPSNVISMQGMFELSSISEFVVPKLGDMCSFTTPNLVNTNSMFRDCASIKKFSFNKSVEDKHIADARYMFLNCASLTRLDLRSFYIEDRYIADDGQLVMPGEHLVGYHNGVSGSEYMQFDTIEVIQTDENMNKGVDFDIMGFDTRQATYYLEDDYSSTPSSLNYFWRTGQWGNILHYQPNSLRVLPTRYRWAKIISNSETFDEHFYFLEWYEIKMTDATTGKITLSAENGRTLEIYPQFTEYITQGFNWSYFDPDSGEEIVLQQGDAVKLNKSTKLVYNCTGDKVPVARFIEGSASSNGTLMFSLEDYNPSGPSGSAWEIPDDGYNYGTSLWYSVKDNFDKIQWDSSMQEHLYFRNLSNWFKDCSNVKNVDLRDNIKFDWVKDLSGICDNCAGLKEIYFPSDVDSAFNVQACCRNCSQLENVDFGNIRCLDTLCDEALAGANNVKRIKMSRNFLYGWRVFSMLDVVDTIWMNDSCTTLNTNDIWCESDNTYRRVFDFLNVIVANRIGGSFTTKFSSSSYLNIGDYKTFGFVNNDVKISIKTTDLWYSSKTNYGALLVKTFRADAPSIYDEYTIFLAPASGYTYDCWKHKGQILEKDHEYIIETLDDLVDVECYYKKISESQENFEDIECDPLVDNQELLYEEQYCKED